MRLFAYPAALFLAFVLYCAAPKFAGGLARALQKLYAFFQRLDARAPRKLAFPAFLLTLMLVPFLLALLHPAVEAVLMAFPLFGLSCIPRSGAVKRELDSGAYSRDIPAYESLVRETCAALAPAFVAHVCVPLVLMAVGLPLRLSAALGWGFLALSAVSSKNEQADRLLGLLVRPADALFSFLPDKHSGRRGGRDRHARPRLRRYLAGHVPLLLLHRVSLPRDDAAASAAHPLIFFSFSASAHSPTAASGSIYTI